MSKVTGIRVLIFVMAWARWKGLGRVVFSRVGVGESSVEEDIGAGVVIYQAARGQPRQGAKTLVADTM